MKVKMLVLVCMVALTATACSGKFWGGVGGGAIGAGAAYEVRAQKETDRVKDLLNKGEIDQREYDIRTDQIKRMALFQK